MPTGRSTASRSDRAGLRLHVVAIGRLKAGPERDLDERYRSRAVALARPLGFAGPEVTELPEGRARRADERQADEATRLRERIGGSLPVILDEGAPPVGSEAFAKRLAAWRDGGRASVGFVIGGADGLAADLKSSGGWSFCFGALTLPHGLVRVLLMEQIYRAFTIMAGHPYHRAGGGEG